MKIEYSTREEKAAATLRNVRAYRERQRTKQAARAAARRSGKTLPRLSHVGALPPWVEELVLEPLEHHISKKHPPQFPPAEVEYWLQQPPYPPHSAWDVEPRDRAARHQYAVDTVRLGWHLSGIYIQRHEDWVRARQAEALTSRGAEPEWRRQMCELIDAFEAVLDHPYHPIYEREFAMRKLWLRAQARKIYGLYHLEFL
ncbi:hypothetical protein GGX14DRAFT_562235 [Mycena pura]|uniref:Uncharacterized protein n=1 Tax=Mycena pura TaxID=153505 RepID=A0AAD6YFE4_9AGAR|nr:hypothetical protein GGX14DRAFT_562235 [Mycena pura]